MFFTSQAMRELEARVIAGGVSADALMEEAGLGIARAVRQFFPWPGVCLAVFGKGNNGGDALVAARHLSEVGWDVKLVPAFPEAEWGPLVREKYRALGSPACATDAAYGEALMHAQGRALIVLDGLLGTGAGGELRGPIASAARRINRLRAESHAHVFALDLPTGLHGDTGVVAENCVIADTTITIGYPKVGLVADSATAVVGRLALVVLDDLAVKAAPDTHTLTTGQTLAQVLPRRSFDTHKGTYGRVGIIAGGRGTIGAAALTATACVRAGAGLVTLYSDTEAAAHLASMCPPEVMVRPLDLLTKALQNNHDVFALGPGLARHHAEAREIIRDCERPMVIDADGLNALAGHLDLLGAQTAERVLTPHPGEMERLAPGRLAHGRRTCAEEFAREHPNCTVLLKGARTVVAKHGEVTSYNSTGNAGLATGGMGDTLTGVIAALMGQHVLPSAAARLGAWLCGRAAEIAISHGGETEETLTPTKLVDHLARAFRDLRGGCF